MKRPSFQFYPGDWQANSKLRRCTHEEKGIWIDVMCLLHDQEEYGVVRWPLKDIAHVVGSTVAKLRGLVEKGVLKGADAGELCEALIFTPVSGRRKFPSVTLIDAQNGPIWYSSRMVEDEYKRHVRGGSKTGQSDSPNPSPTPPFGEYIGASPNPSLNPSPHPSPSRARASSSSSSSSSSLKASSVLSSSDPPVRESGADDTRFSAAPFFSPSPPVGQKPSVIPITGGTRKGRVCGLLRQAGMADAAPSYLSDETWEAIFALRTDEEIVSMALAKMAARPGQRTGLKYIAPSLLDPPKELAKTRDSQPISPFAPGAYGAI